MTDPQAPGGATHTLCLVLAVTGAMLLGRALFSDATTSGHLFVAGAVFPAIVLAALLTASLWRTDDLARVPRAAALLRIALACAAGGFVLHNMVTYSLWMPGPASVFYLAVGACAARGGGRRRGLLVIEGRWIVPLLGAAVVVVLALTVWLPVLRRTLCTADMLRALEGGDTASAMHCAAAAAYVDPLDPQAAADAASAALLHAQGPAIRTFAGKESIPVVAAAFGPLQKASEMARRARDLDRWNAQYAQLAANVAWTRAIVTHGAYARHVEQGNAAYAADRVEQAHVEWAAARRLAPLTELTTLHGGVLDAFVWAVHLNPMGIRLRLAYARALCDADRPRESLGQLDEAVRIDGRLLPGSVEHLTASELKELQTLRARAEFLLQARQ